MNSHIPERSLADLTNVFIKSMEHVVEMRIDQIAQQEISKAVENIKKRVQQEVACKYHISVSDDQGDPTRKTYSIRTTL